MTDKELQISGKIFGYKNPEELEQALMEADIKEKYNGLLNDLNIKFSENKSKPKLTFHAQN